MNTIPCDSSQQPSAFSFLPLTLLRCTIARLADSFGNDTMPLAEKSVRTNGGKD